MKLREVNQQGEMSDAQLADLAGQLRTEKAAIERHYNEIRMQLEKRMQEKCLDNPDVLTGKETLTIEGSNFNVTYKRGKKRLVKIKNLFKKRLDLFWALVKVGVGDLEKTIGEVEASEFILTDYADTPELTIVPRKPSKNQEETKPILRVA